MPIAIGDVLAGKYRIDSVIGEGAMGTVYRAHHTLLDVAVAVKVLPPSLIETPGIVDRFLREARAVARLKSEHVAHVMDVSTLDGGQPYIVMELLEGEDLRDRLGRVGRLPVQQSIDYIMQALEAMAHAHAAGIVHRDLKPENLFVATTSDGRESIRVLDFGIAKLSLAGGTSHGGRLTAQHTVLGSPSYMAPEQVRDSSQIDGRADLWAIGAILYELVTGKQAFAGGSVGEIFASVLHTTPKSMRALLPKLPPTLEAVVAGCLTREPDERYANVGELAQALAPLASAEWSAQAERIEQILLRSQRLSDPTLLGPPESGPASVRAMRGRLSSVPAPPSGIVALGRAPSRKLAPSLGERATFLPGTTPRNRWALILLEALTASAMIVGLARVRVYAPKGAGVLASGVAENAPLAPPIAPLVPHPAAAQASSLGQPTTPSSGAAPVSAGHGNKSPSIHPGAPPKRQTSPIPHLPGVLGSPD